MSSARTRNSTTGQTPQRASTTSTSSASALRRSNTPDVVPTEQPGLRRIVQQRLLKDVFESTSGTFVQ